MGIHYIYIEYSLSFLKEYHNIFHFFAACLTAGQLYGDTAKHEEVEEEAGIITDMIFLSLKNL